MTRFFSRRLLGMAALIALASPATAAQAPVTPNASPMEPAPGTLQLGQTMRVDDGTCPTGQIKRITVGNMTSTARIRTCVKR